MATKQSVMDAIRQIRIIGREPTAEDVRDITGGDRQRTLAKAEKNAPALRR